MELLTKHVRYMGYNLMELTKTADTEYTGKCKAHRCIADGVATHIVVKGTVQYSRCQ